MFILKTNTSRSVSRNARSAFACLTLALFALAGGCASSTSATGQSEAQEENAIVHQVSEADLAFTKSKEQLKADTAVIWVNGLGCPLCATNIDRQLVRLKGVEKVNVDLSNGKVTLGMKPGAEHPSPARLGDAVADAGFTLVKVEAK